MNTNYENIKYDAFISYRHTSPDLEIAEKLHTLLETNKPPKGFKKIKRVFRDRDELPTSSNLADSILDALKNSGYLIVICSPRTPLSQWVIQEIVTFRELHGNDRILALLIEGEPEESFPKELLYVDGVQIEPLAADIRAKDLKTMKKKLKVELLRLLAPIYGCNFDDLKQRHRTRRMKRIATVLGCVTIFSLLFGSFSLRQALLLQEKTVKLELSEAELVKTNDDLVITNDSLESANDQLASQNETLEFQMNEILTGQSKYIAKAAIDLANIGDSRTAILLATEALPSNYEPLDRPYVPEAEYALFKAIDPYKLGSDFTGDFYAHHSDGVDSMKLSPDNKYIVTQTIDEQLYVWDIDTQVILYQDTTYEYSLVDNAEFMPDTTELVYISESGLQQVDYITGEVIWNSGLDVANFITHVGKDLLVAQGSSEIYIMNWSTGGLLETLPLDLNLREAEFSDNGLRFVCEDYDNKILAFNINPNNNPILEKALEVDTLHKNFIYYGISNDSQTLVASSNDYSDSIGYKVGKGEIKFYNISTGSEIASLASDSESFMMPVFNNGNSDIIHWYSDTTIHSYNIATNTELPTMAHGEIITQMATSLDGTLLMASAYDETIRYFEVETGTEYEFARFNVPGGVSDFDISDNVLVTMGTLQEDIIVWTNNEGPSLTPFNFESSTEQGYYIGNNQCVTISYDNKVLLWDTETMKYVKVIDEFDTSLSSEYFAEDDSLLIIDDDGNATLYDTTTFEVTHEVELKSYSYYRLAINKTTGDIAYVDENYNAVILYDSNLNFKSSIPIDQFVNNLTYSEDGDYIALHDNESSRAYLLSDTKSSFTLPSSDFITFSSLSDLVAISTDRKFQIYDQTKPKTLLHELEFTSAISAIKFSPNKDEILIALDDESLYLYDCESQDHRLIDNELYSKVVSIEFENDMCLTGFDYSGIIQFRDINNYVTTCEIGGFVDLSTDGTSVLVKDNNSLLQGPKLSPQDLIELGKTIVHDRVLSEAEKQQYSITTP